MASLAKIDSIKSVRSHYLQIDRGRLSKEELHPVLVGSWRGQPCTLEVSCDRYTTSDGNWTTWRSYGRAAYPADSRDQLSDTARARLANEGMHLVTAWLESEAYPVSRRNAMGHLLQRTLRDDAGHMYSTEPAPDTRSLLANYEDEFPEELLSVVRDAIRGLDALRLALDWGKTT